jgi:Glycosyltransferase family 28 C-terminal domain.
MMIRRNILICPLNWGIGHATRCVPIIKTLLDLNQNVIVAADKAPLAFLRKEFPDLEYVLFPGLEVQYSKSNSQVLKMAMMVPEALFLFRKDHFALKKIIRDYAIDAVISDNRFGAWSSKVPGVFMTHQLKIRIPEFWRWTRPLIDGLNRHYIRHYDECWVPDFPDSPFFAGHLSDSSSLRMKTRRIGLLSRFAYQKLNADSKPDIDFLAILSGPEPQRSLFENILLGQMEGRDGKMVILRGIPEFELQLSGLPENVKTFNHVDDAFFLQLVSRAKTVICRSGYSTLMDLVAIGRGAFLVPTPGQTEQEYLAEYLSETSCFEWSAQNDFGLDKVEAFSCHKALPFKMDSSLLHEQLKDWLNNMAD